MAEPDHRSGALSSVFLLLSVPVIGRLFISEAIRRMQMSDHPRYGLHLQNVLLDLPATIRTLGRDFIQRVTGRRRPHVFIENRTGRYPLHYHAEHRPNAESRITLDDVGAPRIDLRFSTKDAEGVERAHRVLDMQLRSAGLGRLEFAEQSISRRVVAILDQATDGYHQLGATRMAASAAEGVVNADCRVFGTRNLYIAGTSLFPSSGQANPTFPAIALALRLADHLS